MEALGRRPVGEAAIKCPLGPKASPCQVEWPPALAGHVGHVCVDGTSERKEIFSAEGVSHELEGRGVSVSKVLVLQP